MEARLASHGSATLTYGGKGSNLSLSLQTKCQSLASYKETHMEARLELKFEPTKCQFLPIPSYKEIMSLT